MSWAFGLVEDRGMLPSAARPESTRDRRASLQAIVAACDVGDFWGLASEILMIRLT